MSDGILHKYKNDEKIENSQILDISLSLRYSIGKFLSTPTNCSVGIHVNNYYVKHLRLANEMFELLKEAIPFKYEIQSEPEVFIMGPPCRERMLMLKMVIKFDVPNPEEQLKLAGFWSGYESH